jgi:hypothetical protein
MSQFMSPLSREDSVKLGKQRRGRNIAMLVALLALTALFYAITLVRMGAHPA